MMETSRKTKFIQEKKMRCSPLLAAVGSKHSRLLGLVGSYLLTMCVQYPWRPEEGHQHSQELEPVPLTLSHLSSLCGDF